MEKSLSVAQKKTIERVLFSYSSPTNEAKNLLSVLLHEDILKLTQNNILLIVTNPRCPDFEKKRIFNMWMRASLCRKHTKNYPTFLFQPMQQIDQKRKIEQLKTKVLLTNEQKLAMSLDDIIKYNKNVV